MEDPEYEDFRAEASLQKRRQQENFAKAAEAFKQGKKDVASFYAPAGNVGDVCCRGVIYLFIFVILIIFLIFLIKCTLFASVIKLLICKTYYVST